MADITITIDNLHLQRALTAICARYRYDLEKLEGETKGQFAKRMVAEWVKFTTKRYEAKLAREAAAAAVEDIDAT